MKALIHLSHCSSSRPDGWSGAPGEAAWVRDLVARIVTKCTALGVETLTVDGDLNDHPAFHDPTYGAFLAPHYESDTHGDHARGWLWGRASASLTAAEDDRYGAIFERRYRALIAITDGPAEHPDWMTVNITDYYGFRLDCAVPGILVEHGIGAPGAADHDWLREHIDEIADVHAHALAEFFGIKKEDDMAFRDDKDAQAFVAAVSTFEADAHNTFEAMKAAYDPLVGAARAAGIINAEQEAHLAKIDELLPKMRDQAIVIANLNAQGSPIAPTPGGSTGNPHDTN